MMPTFHFEVWAFSIHTFTLYICLFVCFQENEGIQAKQKIKGYFYFIIK